MVAVAVVAMVGEEVLVVPLCSVPLLELMLLMSASERR